MPVRGLPAMRGMSHAEHVPRPEVSRAAERAWPIRGAAVRPVAGTLLWALGFLVAGAFGLWVVSYIGGFLYGMAGWGGVLVSLPFAPVLLALVPWWVGFGQGDWTLLALTYGVGTLSLLMIWGGARLRARASG